MSVLRAVPAAVLAASIANAGTAHGPPCATDHRSFRASEAVLETVEGARWVVTIRDAGSMMATGAGAAVRSFVSTLARAGTGEAARDAAALLSRAGDSPAEGFASLARREVRIGIREDGGWVAFARLDGSERSELLARWKPSVAGDGTLLDRATGVAMATRDGWLVLASEPESLPATLGEGWRSPAPTGPEDDATVVAKIEAMARRPCGGEPIRAVGECEGERFSMRLRFRAGDRPPIAGPVPALGGPSIVLDAAELGRLAEGAILCEIASMRTDADADDGRVLAVLPEVRMPATFRQNLGARRVFAVGEVEGGSLARPLSMRCPAVAVACEVEDPAQARGDQDSLVLAAVAGLRRLLESDPETAGLLPPIDPVAPASRTIPLETPIERMAGRNPWFSAMELAWGVVDGTESRWQVYATHPAWREDLSRRLAAVPARPESPCDGSPTFVSIGRFDGERLGRHLEGWLVERDRFDAVAGPFWDEITICARLARHVPRLEWKASRRGPAILVEFDARLAEP